MRPDLVRSGATALHAPWIRLRRFAGLSFGRRAARVRIAARRYDSGTFFCLRLILWATRNSGR